MRIITDTFAYCQEHIPRWNTISISGYHIREAGSTAVQEVAFTLANGIAYVQAAIDAGLAVDEFAPRLAFFFNAHNNFFEEVAKFRAARRMWYRIMTERFGAQDERSKMLRFHTQTGGSTLTAQQPENNVARVTLQALAAVLGGTQSLHTNSYDEALGLPTERAAKIALRTQQIIGFESGVTSTIDPLGGSFFVESLTDEVEAAAWRYIEKIDEMGGSVPAIEAGFLQDEIERASYEWTKAVDDGSKVIVSVNRFTEDEALPTEIFPIDPAFERNQAQRLADLRARRDDEGVEGGAGGCAGRGPGHPEPPGAHAGSAQAPGHPRRGQRRAAGGIGRLPPVPLSRLEREVRVVFPEAFDEAVEGDVVGGDRLLLLALADDDRVGRLGAGADRRPDRLPAVFVDQAPELLELRIVSPPGHAAHPHAGRKRQPARRCSSGGRGRRGGPAPAPGGPGPRRGGRWPGSGNRGATGGGRPRRSSRS